LNWALVNNMRQAVRWLTPKAAAWGKVRPGDIVKTFCAGTLIYCANIPL
jgi:hypothetical protein